MYNEKLEGKLVLNYEGYLTFKSKSLTYGNELPDYFPLEYKINNEWIECNIIFDKEDNKYYLITKYNDIKYELKKDNLCRIDFNMFLLLDAYRNDCRWRDKIAYEYVPMEIHNSYIRDYCRKTELA